MPLSPTLKRLLLISATLLFSSLAGLAMASVQPGLGADFIGRWLLGWGFVALLAIPVAWMVRFAPQPARAIVRRRKMPARHPGRLG